MSARFRLAVAAVAAVCPLSSGMDPAYEGAPIHYSEVRAETRLTRIEDRIGRGEKLLQGETDQEILRELLGLLEVPEESQVLVYSKTSAQNSLISPARPRAIYFSDNAYVGWVQGGHIEVATFDPQLGIVFHLVTPGNRASGNEDGQRVNFVRERSCLNCHGGAFTDNWPGLMVRSVYPGEDGQPFFQAGTFRTDYRSPLAERWGGWYVTGSAGSQPHMGNIIAREDPATRRVTYQAMTKGAVQSLEGLFPCGAYLRGGVSDIVALMVLEHQVAVHNALVEGALVTRQTLHRHRQMRQAFHEPLDAPLSETGQRIIAARATRITQALLFAGEEPLPAGGIEGSSAFQESFARGARKNSENRSLRDFRLYDRLFKYRCSHLIYSEAFQHLPEMLRAEVLNHLRAVLSGREERPDLPRLSAAERTHIQEILSQTLEGW